MEHLLPSDVEAPFKVPFFPATGRLKTIVGCENGENKAPLDRNNVSLWLQEEFQSLEDRFREGLPEPSARDLLLGPRLFQGSKLSRIGSFVELLGELQEFFFFALLEDIFDQHIEREDFVYLSTMGVQTITTSPLESYLASWRLRNTRVGLSEKLALSWDSHGNGRPICWLTRNFWA